MEKSAEQFWSEKAVLVAGGSGFIGSNLVEALVKGNANVTSAISPRSISRNDSLAGARTRIVKADLTNAQDWIEISRNHEVVINAAHIDGSVTFKRKSPASIFRQNMLITLNLLEAARINDVDNVLILSSAEVYPVDSRVPTVEEEAFTYHIGKEIDGYGLSKLVSEASARLFAQEYGMNISIARPSNVYGPRDHFEPDKGRVIPLTIRRAFEGEPIVIWGTGEQVRSFLYVEDLVSGLLRLIEKSPLPEPFNFAGLERVTVRHLVELIVRMVGNPTEVTTAPEKPSGPATRLLDISRAKHELQWSPTTSLTTGLTSTIGFFRGQYYSRVVLE